MKLYLSKYGFAHADLSLEETVELESALDCLTKTFPGSRPKAQEMLARFKALCAHWMHATEEDHLGARPPIRPGADGKPRRDSPGQSMLFRGNQSELPARGARGGK